MCAPTQAADGGEAGWTIAPYGWLAGFDAGWGTIRAGYRYLAVDYETDGFLLDAALQGPVLGAAFRF